MTRTEKLSKVGPLRVGRFAAFLAASIAPATGGASSAVAQTESVLYSFTGGNDGANPYAGLTLNGSTLYGAAFSGGAKGQGAVFSLATSGGTPITLTSFFGNGTTGSGQCGGAGPVGTPIIDASDNILGTATYGYLSGGVGYGDGLVYQLTPNGSKLRMHGSAHLFGKRR